MAQIQKTTYGKLVRDRSPEIISENGEVPRARVLPAEGLFPALIAKLHEEADELAAAVLLTCSVNSPMSTAVCTEPEVAPRESNNHLPISTVRRCGAVVQILEEVSK